jgi:hypothetical protein
MQMKQARACESPMPMRERPSVAGLVNQTLSSGQPRRTTPENIDFPAESANASSQERQQAGIQTEIARI